MMCPDAAISAHIASTYKMNKHQVEGIVSSCDVVANNLLESYAPNDIIVEIDAEMMAFWQQANKWLMGYVKALWNKVLQIGHNI